MASHLKEKDNQNDARFLTGSPGGQKDFPLCVSGSEGTERSTGVSMTRNKGETTDFQMKED